MGKNLDITYKESTIHGLCLTAHTKSDKRIYEIKLELQITNPIMDLPRLNQKQQLIIEPDGAFQIKDNIFV